MLFVVVIVFYRWFGRKIPTENKEAWRGREDGREGRRGRGGEREGGHVFVIFQENSRIIAVFKDFSGFQRRRRKKKKKNERKAETVLPYK